jgi:hypothetical protein
MEKIKKICKCGKEFKVYHSLNRIKFCSRKCYHKYRDMSWVKTSNITKICKCGREFRIYPYRKDIAKFCSKKCSNKWRKKIISGYKCPKGSMAKLGNKNPQFGKLKKNPSYEALHAYMHRILDKDKPLKCSHCGEEKKLELSSIEHKYTRNLKDWQWLCKRCHFYYDKHEKYLELGRKKKSL